MRVWLAGLLVLGCLGCKSRETAPRTADPAEPALRLAIITDLKGTLEPCGCTSRPLGGIDRTAAKVRSLRNASVPVLLLLGGDLFFDTDRLDPVRVDQANRNADTLVGILNDLEVSAALPGALDRAQPSETLSRLQAESKFPWLAMTGDTEVIRVDANGVRVAIVGVRPGADPDATLAAIGTAQAEVDLTVAVVYGSRRDANRIAAIDGVDFVVHGGLDEEEPVAPHEAGSGWVLHAGRQGQGLTVVDVYRTNGDSFRDASDWSRRTRAEALDAQIASLSQKIETWKKSGADLADLEVQGGRLETLQKQRRDLDSPPSAVGGNAFNARWIEFDPDAPSDRAVADLMKAHDKVVNDANREAFADLAPRPLGPGDVAYVGSKACSTCHVSAYSWWEGHPHGHAYETLQTRHKEFNLDCVGCHVTGYDQPGGSTVTQNLDGALVDVGCESCHGPGGAHSKNPGAALVRNPPESTCVTCHNEEHSDQFNYEQYRDAVMVPGHGRAPK